MGSFYQGERELATLQMLGKTQSNKSLRSKNLETENSVRDNEDTVKTYLEKAFLHKIKKNNILEQKTEWVRLVNCTWTVHDIFRR